MNRVFPAIAVILIETGLRKAVHYFQFRERFFKVASFSGRNVAPNELVNFNLLNALFLTMLYMIDKPEQLKR